MPGKHAPESPSSFYLSIARAGAGALAALALVIFIVLVAVNSRGDDPPPVAQLTSSPTESATPRTTPSPPATSTPSPTPTPTPTQARALLARSRVTVEVLNGTGRAGLAASVEVRLRRDGYRRIEIDNAPSTGRTTIFYRGGKRAEAERLLRDFPEFRRIRKATGSTPGSARLTVVLGTNHNP